MAKMTDPHDALVSYQQALEKAEIAPQKCKLHPELSLLLDDANGTPRLTYALVQDGKAKGIVIYLFAEPLEGKHCFGIGYAVAEEFRNQGIAKKIIQMSIDEMQNGFKDKLSDFYVEAIVSASNIPSQKVAARLISSSPKEVTDQYSGQAAYQYVRLIN